VLAQCGEASFEGGRLGEGVLIDKGKLMRRLLRARELGLPEGDLSTLEEAPSH
jgi:hypothetical protein